jgi:hypothetical protein
MAARRARLRSEGGIVRLATEISAPSKMALQDLAQQHRRTLRAQLEALIFEEAKRNANH